MRISLFYILLILTISLLFLTIVKLNPTHIKILKLDEKDLIKNFKERNIDSSYVLYGLNSNLLALYDSTESINLKLEKEPISQIDTSVDEENDEIKQTLKDLFYLFTEEYSIKERPSFYKKMPFFIQKALINSGLWSPLCEDISEISATYLMQNLSYTIHSEPLYIPSINHYVTRLIYTNNKDTLVLCIDFQNGFLGPINKSTKSPLTIKELKERVQKEDFKNLGLYFLPDSILINKKTLVPKEYPANIFPDENLRIYKTPLLHLYPAYRRTYPTHYYLWFYKHLESEPRIIEEISKELHASILN